jgi:hypothetical protein
MKKTKSEEIIIEVKTIAIYHTRLKQRREKDQKRRTKRRKSFKTVQISEREGKKPKLSLIYRTKSPSSIRISTAIFCSMK